MDVHDAFEGLPEDVEDVLPREVVRGLLQQHVERLHGAVLHLGEERLPGCRGL